MDVETPAAVRKSISICSMGGTLSSYFQDFERDYRRPTRDVWAINSAGVWMHDCDLIMALDNFRRDLKEHEQYVKNIVGRGIPVISDVTDPEWPNVTAYPLRRVLDSIWPQAKSVRDIIPPLYNTCNYALALAIADEYDEIRLYGCNFAINDDRWMLHEQANQHPDKPFWWPYHMKSIVMERRDREPGGPTMHFLLGIAHERGIKVHIPMGETLCEVDRIPHFYGYEDQPDPYEDRTNLKARAAAAFQEAEALCVELERQNAP